MFEEAKEIEGYLYKDACLNGGNEICARTGEICQVILINDINNFISYS